MPGLRSLRPTAKQPFLATSALAAAIALAPHTHAQTAHLTCAAKPHGNATALTSTTLYTPSNPGFDLNTLPSSFSANTCASDKPFFLSLPLPEGVYRVTVTLGGPQASTTTVRAEARRLMLHQLSLPAHKTQTVSFAVSIRTPQIPATADTPATEVKRKPRELNSLRWDNKLTLEFNGAHPSFTTLDITPAPTVPVLYLAGDSTVVDQDNEPWAAWGQMLPVFLSDRIAVANHAESGETIKSFFGELRWAKVLSTLKPGDFVMAQFAHNDQKPGPGNVPIPEYKDLLRRIISDSRAHGATPILVTSMNRRTFDAASHITHTLGDYPQATRDIAAEQHVGLIDLNTLSKTLYEAWGPTESVHAFVHYPANTFPNQTAALADDTHFNSYGAYELARSIIQSIRDQHLPLEPFLRPNLPAFNPAHPDPIDSLTFPQSPFVSIATPYGR